jgi:hypothetical protein
MRWANKGQRSGRRSNPARLGEVIDLPSIDAAFCAHGLPKAGQVGSVICSIIYLNELMTSANLHKNWASADNIFAVSELMAAFRLCENNNQTTDYLL